MPEKTTFIQREIAPTDDKSHRISCGGAVLCQLPVKYLPATSFFAARPLERPLGALFCGYGRASFRAVLRLQGSGSAWPVLVEGRREAGECD